MKNNCSKYESLFVFGNQKDLDEHLKICSECQREHFDMEKIAEIVKEVKPHIKRKNAVRPYVIKAVASIFIIFTCFWSINQYNQQLISNLNQESDLFLSQGHSEIAEMGLPTDEYGLLNTESQDDQL